MACSEGMRSRAIRRLPGGSRNLPETPSHTHACPPLLHCLPSKLPLVSSIRWFQNSLHPPCSWGRGRSAAPARRCPAPAGASCGEEEKGRQVRGAVRRAYLGARRRQLLHGEEVGRQGREEPQARWEACAGHTTTQTGPQQHNQWQGALDHVGGDKALAALPAARRVVQHVVHAAQ